MPDRPSAVRGQLPAPRQPPPRQCPERSFPEYRHTPGLTPHPRSDPRGHSHGEPEPEADLGPPEEWRECRCYLWAIDLYNNGFWWECHEALESLWIEAGKRGPQALFFQAIIQAAAANIKWHLDNPSAARFLTEEASKKFDVVLEQASPAPYMGLDVADFVARLRAFHVGGAAADYPPLINLAG